MFFSRRSDSSKRIFAIVFLGVLFITIGLFASSTLAAPSGVDSGVVQQVQITAVATAIATPITATPVPRFTDLGDAPDSTNHFNTLMTAYPGVNGYYPAVFNSLTGLPPGPRHWNQPLRYHLGPTITYEIEADIGFDADGINNIVPLNNDKNNDLADDGLNLPVSLPHCQTTTLTYQVTVVSGGLTQLYFNAWADYNRNGVWGDVLLCPFTVAPEWAISNQLLTFPGPGTYTVTTPTFVVHNRTPNKGMWLRISVAESPAPAPDGQGPLSGYSLGETEDYKLPGIIATATATFQATPIEIELPPTQH